jgi:uncharacterized protein (TIGR03118 family)
MKMFVSVRSQFFTGLVAISFFAVSLLIAPQGQAQTGYLQTNLVSDVTGVAANTDPNLQNAWGIASSATSPFWVSDNGSGLSTLYNSSGTPQALVVTVPAAGSASGGTPTGVVFNGSSDFQISTGTAARFIFATEDGTISGWASGTQATVKVDNAPTSAVYKGLALGNNGTGNFLYAANFHSSAIDVFNGTYTATTLAGSFTDPNLPAGYAPFNIQNLGGTLYVTYALRDMSGHDDIAGPGNGFVDRFDLNGNFLNRLVSNGVLNSPWGLAIAPSGFGTFANDLLVGNFGDGRINVFDPATGVFLGTLKDPSGNSITIDGLWGLRVGNGGSGGDPNTVYFSAGPNDEANGLFGSLAFVPEPGTLALFAFGGASLIWLRRKKQR